MMNDLKRKVFNTARRVVRTTCVIVGSGLLIVALLAILAPLVLGAALMAFAGRDAAAAATAQAEQTAPYTFG